MSTLRRATVADVPRLVQILNDATTYKLKHGDSAWANREWTDTKIRQSLYQSEVYVIDQSDVPVATFSLSWQDEEYWGPQDPVAGYLHRLSVSNDFHGLGLGGLSIDWCVHQVRTKNRRYLRLDCDPRNTKLCAYYESFGFVRVKVRPFPSGYRAALYEKTVAIS